MIELALGAVVWFLAVTWLDFAWGRHVDFDLVVVTGFFFVFFMVLLLASSFIADDPRWSQPKISFADFLRSDVAIDTGSRRGRDVLMHITLVPVGIALAATLIGLIWRFLH